jgi:hypothetical protein
VNQLAPRFAVRKAGGGGDHPLARRLVDCLGLHRWTSRFKPGKFSSTLQYVADVTGWPRRSDRVLPAARATYLWLPQGTRLWVQQSEYELLDPARMRDMFMTLP